MVYAVEEASRRTKAVWLCLELTLALAIFAVGCTSSYQFPVRKQSKYFEFGYERDNPQIEPMARFADGYVKLINRDFFQADFDYPIHVFVLQNQERFEDFVHRDLRVPGPAGVRHLFAFQEVASNLRGFRAWHIYP